MNSTDDDLSQMIRHIEATIGSDWMVRADGTLVHTQHITRDVWVLPVKAVIEELRQLRQAEHLRQAELLRQEQANEREDMG